MSFRALTPKVAAALPARSIPSAVARHTPAALCQVRAQSTEAIANPTLADIEKRWEAMPPQEQADLWMQLRDRMKTNWHELTVPEKKAAYWISFGPHGPRAETPKGEGVKVFFQVAKTMTKEWQEATNEYAKKEQLDPISGISSEGYSGKGFVQSPPSSN